MEQNKPWSQDLYQKTIRFAASAHLGRKLPGTELPYLVHISNVCMEIMAAVCNGEGDNPDLAIQCALLHDTIEDTAVRFTDIENIFGRDVADGVMALTKNNQLDKKFRMEDSIKRIKLQPREIWMVKLADRITNLQPPPAHWSEDKIIFYRDEAEFILSELGSSSRILSGRLKEKISIYPSSVSS